MQNVDKFNSENFRSFFESSVYLGMSPVEREALIRFAVEQVRLEKGLATVDVSFVKAPCTTRGSTHSAYTDDDQVLRHHIRLNEDSIKTPDQFSSYSVYKTIHHELRHDYQREIEVDKSVRNDDPYALEQRLGSRHYYRYAGDKKTLMGYKSRFDGQIDKQLYYAQACEQDARDEAMRSLEELQRDVLPNDETLNAYRFYQKQSEANTREKIYDYLGVHSREELAKEELSHVSEDCLSPEERSGVLAYAREKDLEQYIRYVKESSRPDLSQEQIRREFAEDFKADNFYKTNAFQKNKASGAERKQSDLSRYKFEPIQQERMGGAQGEEAIPQPSEHLFVGDVSGKSAVDEQFAQQYLTPHEPGESAVDKSFWKRYCESQDTEEKWEGEVPNEHMSTNDAKQSIPNEVSVQQSSSQWQKV